MRTWYAVKQLNKTIWWIEVWTFSSSCHNLFSALKNIIFAVWQIGIILHKDWLRDMRYSERRNSMLFDNIMCYSIYFALWRCYCNVTFIGNRIDNLSSNPGCPVGWGCRIYRLLLCRGVRPPPQSVSWIWH